MVEKGTVLREPQRLQTYADYVDTRIGTGHSRWMIAPGPWMPFSMVKLSPDNQNAGWQAGYQPTFENIGCFSHIHEWTLGGLGLMPTNGKLVIQEGDEMDPIRVTALVSASKPNRQASDTMPSIWMIMISTQN